MSTISNLVHINLNTREEGIFEDFEAFDSVQCEEFGEYAESTLSDSGFIHALGETRDPVDSDGE